MPELKHLLCATDFSACSKHAYEVAAELAVKLGASITLVHVYQYPIYALPDGVPPPVIPPDYEENLKNELLQRLGDFAKSVETGGTVPVLRLVEGLAPDEIVETAVEIGADMIVIGTHGRTGLAHLLIGSVAERIVRHASVPVLTVRSP